MATITDDMTAWLELLRGKVEELHAAGQLTPEQLLAAMKELRAGKPIAGARGDTFNVSWVTRRDDIKVTLARQLQLGRDLVFLHARLIYPRSVVRALPTGGEYEAAYKTYDVFERRLMAALGDCARAHAPEFEVGHEIPGPDVDVPA
jgi:hypothetical protein